MFLFHRYDDKPLWNQVLMENKVFCFLCILCIFTNSTLALWTVFILQPWVLYQRSGSIFLSLSTTTMSGWLVTTFLSICIWQSHRIYMYVCKIQPYFLQCSTFKTSITLAVIDWTTQKIKTQQAYFVCGFWS